MLAAFHVTAAKDRCWWSHWCSLGWPDTSTSFFARPLKKGWWTCHTHKWSQLQLVESGNCFGVHGIFGILQPQPLLLQSLLAWHCLCSGPKQKCPQLLHPILDLGLCTRAQSQNIRPPSVPCQSDRLQGRREINAGQWPFENWVDGWMSREAACVFSTR